MNALLSVAYIVECSLFATLMSASLSKRINGESSISVFLAWVLIFFTAFFGGFYLLGYVNLATGLPVVDPIHSSLLGLILLAACTYWLSRSQKRLEAGRRFARLAHSVSGMFQVRGGIERKLTLLTVGIFTVIALMLTWGFPGGYEAQAYHLPLGLHIFQSHSLKIWDTTFVHTFPANASVYFGFLLSLLPEQLAAPGNVVFLVPLFLAIYGLGRTTGADANASWLAALGILTIPIVAFGAFEAEADVGGLTFLAIAIYFAMARCERPLVCTVLSGLAAGIAFGFKSLHLISIAFLVALTMAQAYRESEKQTRLKRLWNVLRPAGIFSVSTLVMASFWMVRNYLQLGNPLYPIYYPMFDLLGWTKAPDVNFSNVHRLQFEWVRSAGEWFFYPWLEWHYAGENFKSSSGLGAFFAATVPIACVFGLIKVIKKDGKYWPAIPSLLSGGAVVLLVWALLDDRQPRYAMGALPFLVPLVAAMISASGGGARRALEVTIAICIMVMLFVIFSKKLVEFGTRFVYARQNSRHAFYGYPKMIDQLPPGSSVVNFARRTLNYGLFGSNHQNRVISYTVSFRALEAPAHGRTGEEAADAGMLKYATLKALGATHIVTEGFPVLALEDCVSLQEIDRLDKDAKPLEKPFRLFRINYCRAGESPLSARSASLR